MERGATIVKEEEAGEEEEEEAAIDGRYWQFLHKYDLNWTRFVSNISQSGNLTPHSTLNAVL